MTWEGAVEWARNEPTMSDLVQVCYYDDPIEKAAQRFIESEEWEAIKEFLPTGKKLRVLELGAGRGIVGWAFASEGCEVHALEPDPSILVGAGAIEILCERTGQSINVVDSVGEKLCFDDNYFDYVYCRGVMHHVEDPFQVCREVERVLKPGGRFLVIKEHVANTDEELAEFLRIHPLNHLYGGEHAFPLKVYKKAILGAGFKGLKIYGHYDHPVSSAPAILTSSIRGQLQNAVSRRFGDKIGNMVAHKDFMLHVYRRWLTWRCDIPGRLYSFYAEKPY